MNEDLELLRRAIEEPVHQMLLAEVSSPQHAVRLAQRVREWSGSSRPVKTLSLDANHDNAREFYDSCQQLTANWSQDDEPPGLLLLTDASVPDVRIAHPTAQEPTSVGFWRSMNLLREGWNDLPCQTIFLITPQQYHLFSTEADHLKRWIPLKLHIEQSENAPIQPRHERGIVEPSKEELRPKFAGQDDLDDRESAAAQWDSLRQRELLAVERGDNLETVARRQRLPLFAAAITLEKWDVAARYDTLLKDVSLPVRDELRRLNLETFFQQRQGHSQKAETVAKSALDLALKKGKESDQVTARWTLGTLYDLEKQWDKYENVLQQLIKLRPNEVTFLGNYAIFLNNVRGDHDRAEEFYKRALESDPNDADILGNYAIFLTNVRGDHDRAEEFYKRALESEPNRADILGNYANLLTDVRGDHDRAEEFYKRAIESDPSHASTLGSYAILLKNVRGDYDRAEEFYKRAIESDPNHANNLVNYAIFLKNVRGDHDRAEEFYKRAIEVDPARSGNYAVFLCLDCGDSARAEPYFRKALEVAPNDPRNIINAAAFFLIQDKREEGRELLDRAAALEKLDQEQRVAIAFHRYIHFPREKPTPLSQLKQRLKAGDRAKGWSFDLNIKRARQEKHPNTRLLGALAQVISGEKEIKILNQFPEWAKA